MDSVKSSWDKLTDEERVKRYEALGVKPRIQQREPKDFDLLKQIEESDEQTKSLLS